MNHRTSHGPWFSTASTAMLVYWRVYHCIMGIHNSPSISGLRRHRSEPNILRLDSPGETPSRMCWHTVDVMNYRYDHDDNGIYHLYNLYTQQIILLGSLVLWTADSKNIRRTHLSQNTGKEILEPTPHPSQVPNGRDMPNAHSVCPISSRLVVFFGCVPSGKLT